MIVIWMTASNDSPDDEMAGKGILEGSRLMQTSTRSPEMVRVFTHLSGAYRAYHGTSMVPQHPRSVTVGQSAN